MKIQAFVQENGLPRFQSSPFYKNFYVYFNSGNRPGVYGAFN